MCNFFIIIIIIIIVFNDFSSLNLFNIERGTNDEPMDNNNGTLRRLSAI